MAFKGVLHCIEVQICSRTSDWVDFHSMNDKVLVLHFFENVEFEPISPRKFVY